MRDIPAATAEQNSLHQLSRAEASLVSLRGDLEQNHRLATLGFLAAGIAHEINNILTPVLSYAQLAKAAPSDTALQNKTIDKTIAGVEAAAQIVQAMLGFAAGEDQHQEANLDRVVRSALDCLARDPAKDGISVQIDVHPDLWVSIRPLALQQVMLNLLINARTAMKGRRGTLRIAATSSSDGKTTIVVSDSGPGIPTEVIERLFQPFATNAAATERRRSGSGLGLAICKYLIEEAGGSISVKSVQGTGATFSIILGTTSAIRAKAG